MNAVSENLLRMTGTEQRMTSAYHPQANGRCGRRNRSIKDSLVKVLYENPTKWPYIIEGILFAHRVSRHYSTSYSPFYLLYNREPILPIVVKYNLEGKVPAAESQGEEPFDAQTFETVLSAAKVIRDGVHEDASKHISKAQEKQKRDYNRRHSLPCPIKVGDIVLLKNNKREDRKGGKFAYKWLCPYTVRDISQSGLCTMINQKGRRRRSIMWRC